MASASGARKQERKHAEKIVSMFGMDGNGHPIAVDLDLKPEYEARLPQGFATETKVVSLNPTNHGKIAAAINQLVAANEEASSLRGASPSAFMARGHKTG